ncbi:hypothetical protein ACP4OV_023937 [Aristida adscensionis]
MATKAICFALCILLTLLSRDAAGSRGLTEYSIAASTTPYCGDNIIDSQGKCDDELCLGLCKGQFEKYPDIIAVSGACHTKSQKCYCEVICEGR